LAPEHEESTRTRGTLGRKKNNLSNNRKTRRRKRGPVPLANVNSKELKWKGTL